MRAAHLSPCSTKVSGTFSSRREAPVAFFRRNKPVYRNPASLRLRLLPPLKLGDGEGIYD